MKTTMIAVAVIGSFGAASGSASADGFAPWDNRAVIEDAPAAVESSANVVSSRFAPWDERNVNGDAIDRDAMVVETPASVFRPWS